VKASKKGWLEGGTIREAIEKGWLEGGTIQNAIREAIEKRWLEGGTIREASEKAWADGSVHHLGWANLNSNYWKVYRREGSVDQLGMDYNKHENCSYYNHSY
ncbi:MAG: hypothetical protein ACI8RD_003272, partial [Bacillariaceae sp.]|jgi:hypothetical protein